MDWLYSTPWPILSWCGLIGAILTTFAFVPFFLKKSNTFFGAWYREMIDEDVPDQDDQRMNIHATSRVACFFYALLTSFFGFSIWWSGTLSATELSHMENQAAQFIIAISLGYNIYEFILLFIMSDWTDRLNSFCTNKSVFIKLIKVFLYIYALDNREFGWYICYRMLYDFQVLFECPMYLLNTIYVMYEGTITSTICVVGFLITLPLRILLILFYWWKFYNNYWSEAFMVLSFGARTVFFLYPAMADFHCIHKIITT